MTKKRQSFPVRGGVERYAAVRRKVDRAQEHISEVGIAVRAFLATRPYVIGTRRDPATRRPTYYVVSVTETPARLADLAGDALHNLRSALDHLTWQLVLAAGNTPGTHTAFPICDSAADYQAAAERRLAGLSAEAVRAIDALQPYKGGNDELWRLHRLDNIDKHRAWLVVGSRLRSVNILPSMVQAADHPMLAEGMKQLGGLWLKPATRIDPLRSGDDLFTDLPDAPVNPETQFAFDVAIHEPEIAEGEPLLETLQRLADLVGHVAYTLAPLVR